MALKFDMSKGDWKRDYAMQQMANQGMNPYRQAGENLAHAAGFAAPAISKFVKTLPDRIFPKQGFHAKQNYANLDKKLGGFLPGGHLMMGKEGHAAYEDYKAKHAATHGALSEDDPAYVPLKDEQTWLRSIMHKDKERGRELRKGALEHAIFPKLGAKKSIDQFLEKTDPMAHLFPLYGQGIKEKLLPQEGQKIRDFMSDPKGAINKKLFPNEGAQFWGSPLGRTLDAAKTKIEGIPAERRRRKRARLRPDTPISDAEPEFYDASYNMIETPEFEQFDEWEQPAKRPTPAPIQEEYDRSQERKHGIKYVEPKKNIFGKEKKGPLQTVIQPNFKKMGFNNLEEMNSSFSQAREINPNLSWKDFTKLAEEGKLEDYLLTPSVTPSNFQLGPM